MPFVKVLKNGQITMPKKLREAFGIKEGDVLEVKMDKNKLVLIPKVFVDKIPESEKELSPKGKEKIKKAVEDFESGEVIGPFTSVKQMRKALKK